MKDILVAILTSKKAVAAIATAIAAIILKLGFSVDEGFINALIALASAYLIGQGVADHGKEAVKAKESA